MSAHKPPAPGAARVSNAKVRLYMELVHARPAQAPRLSKAPKDIIALAQGCGIAPWSTAVQWFCMPFRCCCRADSRTRRPQFEHAGAWQALWVDFPGAWSAILKLARESVRPQPAFAVEVMAACPPLAPWSEPSAEDEADEFICDVCCAWFPSAGNADEHRAKAHQVESVSALKAFVRGPCCPACQQDFHARVRVLQHLRARGDGRGGFRAQVLEGEFSRLDGGGACRRRAM